VTELKSRFENGKLMRYLLISSLDQCVCIGQHLQRNSRALISAIHRVFYRKKLLTQNI